MSKLDEQLSDQFHRWEVRGRGWQVYPQPVFPEPPFVPFPGHYLPSTPVVDDGRKPTFLSSLVQTLSRRLATESEPRTVEPELEEEPEPMPLIREPLLEFQASLPDMLDVSRDVFEQFLLNLSLCREPIVFELLGTHRKVTVQCAAAVPDAPLLKRQLQAFFPEAAFIPVQTGLETAWNNTTGDEMLAVEFGLERECMFPLQSGKLDPFIGLIGALSELQSGELGLFQVLFQPVQNPWAENITDSVTGADGRPFFLNRPELTGSAEKKVSKPLYAAVVRILVCADQFERVLQLASDLAGSLRVFAHPQGNTLIPLKNDEYPFEEHILDVLRRQSRRTGMLLNSDELTGFVHLPSSAVRSPVLQRDTGRSKPVPAMMPQSGIVIGDNEHNGQIIPVHLSTEQRTRHTHIIGSSGTGKSSLLLNLIRQDIENGDGVAVLDPHGDLISQILSIIPEQRMEDVVLVDPSDQDFPIGFNILQAHSEVEKNLLASDLIAVFRRLSSSWGDQMDAVLQNAILAFLESKQGGTLADLRRFLLESAFRSQFMQTVADPEIIYYWQKVFPQLSGGKSIGPILTRLQDFFARKPLRNMVSQRENNLDFRDIMDNGKIFLASLSEGLCGAENSYLLGTLLVSKFQQLAMARQSQTADSRRNFWLYIDEFDHFITPSMAEILKGARKYRLGLTLAHQELHQLKADPKVESAVMTQPCTRIVFRVGDEDAKKLGEGFESFDARSLKNLEKFHAIVRVERNDHDFNLAVRKPELPDSPPSHIEAIMAASRRKYATPRAEVEAALLAAIQEDKQSGKATPAKTPDKPAEAKAEPFTVSGKEQADKAAATPPIPKAPEPPDTTAAEPPVERPQPPRDLGRGGPDHKDAQKRIRREAEKLGFRGIIEKTVLNGQGSVDVWLERDNFVIACEVSLTNTENNESEKIVKCLKGGIPKMAMICSDERKLKKIAETVSDLLDDAALVARVEYFQPEAFIKYLQSLSAAPKKDAVTVSHGYKLKHSKPGASSVEHRAKEDAAIRTIADTMKRKR